MTEKEVKLFNVVTDEGHTAELTADRQKNLAPKIIEALKSNHDAYYLGIVKDDNGQEWISDAFVTDNPTMDDFKHIDKVTRVKAKTLAKLAQ